MKKLSGALLTVALTVSAVVVSGCASLGFDFFKPGERKTAPRRETVAERKKLEVEVKKRKTEKKKDERRPLFDFLSKPKERKTDSARADRKKDDRRSTFSFLREKKAESLLCDIENDYELVSINKDLYLRKSDGSESRRLTYTAEIDEYGHFVERTRYIIYYEKDENGLMSGKYYVIARDGDDRNRKEISWDGFKKLYLGEKD